MSSALEHPPVAWRALGLLAELARRRGDTRGSEEQLATVSKMFDSLAPRIADPNLRQQFLGLGERVVDDPLGSYR